MNDEEYRKTWREAKNKATVSIRVLAPDGREGYCDLTRELYKGKLSSEEFARALKIFLPKLISGIFQGTLSHTSDCTFKAGDPIGPNFCGHCGGYIGK